MSADIAWGLTSETAQPEAFVPLPDGRPIPVQIGGVEEDGDITVYASPAKSRTHTRADCLERAGQAVLIDRAATHGGQEDSFETTAKFWSVYLGVDIRADQVAMMLGLLKIARQKNNPKHTDNYDDLAGYAACAAEQATKE